MQPTSKHKYISVFLFLSKVSALAHFSGPIGGSFSRQTIISLVIHFPYKIAQTRNQAPGVQKLDSVICRIINHHTVDEYWGNQLHCPLDRDLFIRQNWTTQSSVTNIINHNHNTLCDVLALLKIKNTRNSRCFLASKEKKLFKCTWWRILSNYIGLTRTVLLELKSNLRIFL